MGIGGVSMQGLARWYHAEGAHVSGCDAADSEALHELRALGIDAHSGHDPHHITPDLNLLVTSMAVPQAHPEIARAHELGIRVRARIDILGDLFSRRRAIGITGTHGKSTTTGMLAWMLMHSGSDPSIQLGATLPGLDGNMRHGHGPHLVAEVDESDPGFANLHADVAVVGNLEDDHVAEGYSERRNYHASLADLEAATRRYAQAARALVFNNDWPGLQRLLGDHPHARHFGVNAHAHERIMNIHREGTHTHFEIHSRDGDTLAVRLRVPGQHNILNATAALTAARVAGLDPHALTPALESFPGVGRRWQVWGEVAGALVVDDYAHHPTEVRATLQAARERGQRIRAVLQPHRWVRTARLWRELADAAALADEVLVVDVYAAGEAPIDGVGVAPIVERILAAGTAARAATVQGAAALLRPTLRTGDLVITLGAGDVWKVAQALTQEVDA